VAKWVYRRNNSGSFAALAAIRRASSRVSSLAADPIGLILPAFAIIVPEGGLSGSKAMEWFKRKTSIAGYEISNWIIVLGAIIIVLLIFQNLH
jgi:hypothetical protein